MSSPFQQKFSAKNPVKTFTLKQLERQAKKDDKEMYKNSALLPQINQGDYDYESEDEQEFPGDDTYTYEKKTQVKSDSPLNAYVSTAPYFQSMQDKFAAAFTPKEKTGPTSEDKKNQAEEAYWKSKTLTSEENNPFKDRANQIEDDSSSNFDVDLKYNPQTDYSGSYEDSNRGNPFYTGKDKNENIFNKFN